MTNYEELCVALALVSLAGLLFLAWRNRHNATAWIGLSLAAIVVSSIFLYIPCYWVDSEAYQMGDLRAAVFTLFYGLKAMAGGQQIAVLEQYTVPSPGFDTVYRVLNYAYFLAAPLLTSSLALTFIGDRWDRLRFRFALRRRFHIFSELDSNALKVAGHIHARHPKERIVFCSAKKANADLVTAARELHALVLHQPCEGLRMRKKGRHITFYLLSRNEDGNLHVAEQLVCAHRKLEDTQVVINALAESETGIQMVENMDKGRIGLRFTDSVALLCSSLLLQYPLFAIPEKRDTVSVMIVGCDRTGMQMLKTVSWCGRMTGKKLKLRVYDLNAAALEQRFDALCPDLRRSCDIRFIQTDAMSAAFEEAVLDVENGSPDATYVITAMSDDEKNIATAERLYRLFRYSNRFGDTPQILARVRSTAKAAVYINRDNPYLQTRHIRPFGSADEMFCADTLFHSYLERLAFAVDLCYNGLLPEEPLETVSDEALYAYLSRDALVKARTAFLDSEYSRRSSIATALHIPAKLYGCGLLAPGQTCPKDAQALTLREKLDKDPEFLERLAKEEHCRWNCYMRSEGYRTATVEDLKKFYPLLKKPNNQDDLSRRHLALVEWEQLDEVNREYLSMKPPVRKNFKETNRELIRCLPQIILLANRLERTDMDHYIPGKVWRGK